MYIILRLYFIIIYLDFIVKVYCDYYSLLGVKRNATERDIEKAFRKKAKKLHPDVNPGKEEEFAKISNAYETLKDPSKRKIYDQYGEDGLKSDGPQARPYTHYYGDGPQTFFTFEGFDFDDVFSQFSFGGGQGRNQGDRGPRTQVTFEDTIVEEMTPKEYNDSIKNVRVLNLYYFYSANNRTCSNIHRGFIETVTKFKGAIKIYRINCEKYNNFCQKNTKSIPQIIAYKTNSSNPFVFDKEDYTMKLEIWLNKIMPSELVEIKDLKHLQTFIENQTMSHVVCIVKKSLFLTILKSLSVYVKSKVKIGFVRASNRELVNHFKRNRTEGAKLYYLQDFDTMEGKSIELTLDNFSDVLLWLNLRQNEFKKMNVGIYKELTSRLLEAGECGPKDNQFCFIFIKYGNRVEYTLHRELSNISKRYSQDSVKIRYINATNQHKFVSAFGLSSRCPASEVCSKLVAYRGKRGKFKIMEMSLTQQNVQKFIDDVITNLVTLNRPLLHDLKIIDYSDEF
ncbi:Pbj2 [Theileria orientalis strain Shintoku]|uniref:DnaJ homolog subfamily C member 16 n=1 Tax=Theileria orientalis strain Shintoku TaxID=869250 RepID=J4CDW5_THEOR|nr:Pbj2 [Theileria orientalis strain Shintoku]BAM41852.1 Pbj2 [Theileria orientalis strain Shintoku]|eukprot:XP_009692153.1 Pbj2 [Theileria orientalis strain Shintoku]